eukprot:gnl/Trimastix_PCT/1875.p1 GENE.gnl/Trimastix_PCT/1875~~gnl/Trimastix_PCT/1875.p1  ORF type:complete len:1163 (+),score=295.78 gnl/Trimastix_PCT/1875:165-3653(+)
MSFNHDIRLLIALTVLTCFVIAAFICSWFAFFLRFSDWVVIFLSTCHLVIAALEIVLPSHIFHFVGGHIVISFAILFQLRIRFVILLIVLASSIPISYAVKATYSTIVGIGAMVNYFLFTFAFAYLALLGCASIRQLARAQYRKSQQVQRQLAVLVRSKRKNDQLLTNLFPPLIMERVASGKAERFPNAVIVFGDLPSFAQLASSMDSIETLRVLNSVFALYDKLAERYGLLKIKTTGDIYMAVANVPLRQAAPATRCVRFALDAIEGMRLLTPSLGVALRPRFGINVGLVVAGALHTSRIAFDMWGDTVNVASRMMTHGVVEKIQITEAVLRLLPRAARRAPVMELYPSRPSTRESTAPHFVLQPPPLRIRASGPAPPEVPLEESMEDAAPCDSTADALQACAPEEHRPPVRATPAFESTARAATPTSERSVRDSSTAASVRSETPRSEGTDDDAPEDEDVADDDDDETLVAMLMDPEDLARWAVDPRGQISLKHRGMMRTHLVSRADWPSGLGTCASVPQMCSPGTLSTAPSMHSLAVSAGPGPGAGPVSPTPTHVTVPSLPFHTPRTPLSAYTFSASVTHSAASSTTGTTGPELESEMSGGNPILGLIQACMQENVGDLVLSSPRSGRSVRSRPGSATSGRLADARRCSMTSASGPPDLVCEAIATHLTGTTPRTLPRLSPSPRTLDPVTSQPQSPRRASPAELPLTIPSSAPASPTTSHPCTPHPLSSLRDVEVANEATVSRQLRFLLFFRDTAHSRAYFASNPQHTVVLLRRAMLFMGVLGVGVFPNIFILFSYAWAPLVALCSATLIAGVLILALLRRRRTPQLFSLNLCVAVLVLATTVLAVVLCPRGNADLVGAVRFNIKNLVEVVVFAFCSPLFPLHHVALKTLPNAACFALVWIAIIAAGFLDTKSTPVFEAFVFGLALLFFTTSERSQRVCFLLEQDSAARKESLEKEDRRTQLLLKSTLPPRVLSKMRRNHRAIARRTESATVLFADIVKFTTFCKNCPADSVVQTLDLLFTAFDKVCAKHRVSNFSTIGDCYFAGAGVTTSDPAHTLHCVRAALEIVEQASRISRENGFGIHVRVGVGRGPVFSGVLGLTRFTYDVWGPAVKDAKTMEALGAPDSILISQAAKQRLSPASFSFSEGPWVGDHPSYFVSR